jgi:hypothetical protein
VAVVVAALSLERLRLVAAGVEVMAEPAILVLAEALAPATLAVEVVAVVGLVVVVMVLLAAPVS